MGLGTIYMADTVADAPGGIVAAAQILSHIPLGVAAVHAALRYRPELATSAGNAFVVSLFVYHACRTALFCIPLALPQARLLDHFTALSLLGVWGIMFIDFGMASKRGRYVGKVVATVLPVVVLTAVLAFPFQAHSALLVLVFLAGTVMLRYMVFGHHFRPIDFSQYDKRALLVMLVSGALAAACYMLSDSAPKGDSLLDGLAHAGWHLFIGVALNAAIAALPPAAPAVSVQ